MRRTEPTAAEAARERVVYWISRERLGLLTADDRKARDAWLVQDAEHRHQYAAVQASLQATDVLNRDALHVLLLRANATAARRRLLVGSVGACAAAVLGGVALHRYRDDTDLAQVHATARGERRRIVLADGSVLDLNTDSRVRVTLRDAQRDVRIDQGEVLFSVSHDALRPFRVQARDAEVRVTGTRFNVRLEGRAVTVALEEGGVQVFAGPWWRQRTTALRPGDVLRYVQGEPLTAPAPGNIQAIVAWQRGRLVFTDARLSTVVDELNRYLRAPVRIGDPELATLRIAGTLPIDQPEAAFVVLPRIAPIRVLRADDGSAVLLTR